MSQPYELKVLTCYYWLVKERNSGIYLILTWWNYHDEFGSCLVGTQTYTV